MENTTAFITFIKKQKEKPYYDSSAITGLIPKLYFKVEKKLVSVESIRKNKNNNFEKCGYEVVKHRTKFNLKNISNNLDGYKEELNIFLYKRFNFVESYIFDLTRRSNSKIGAKNIDGNRQPADRAHVDYTVKSGKNRAQDIIGKKKFVKILNSGMRIIQLNLWRPLCKTVLSSPLAFAIPSTVLKKDLIATDQIFPDRIGEIYHLAYNKNQKWLWVPKMQRNEVLLLKGWDSNNGSKVPKFVPHSSFNLKNQNIVKYPRESIEARIFLVLNK